MSRSEQDQLVRWVFAAHDAEAGNAPPIPDMALDRFAAAGLATGFTAFVGALADHHSAALPTEWREYVAEQRHEVAERQRRFATILPIVLTILHDADVVAIPVKGAVLCAGVWKFADARPMADIDLIVSPADRRRAESAFAAAGIGLHASTPWEDTFLGWGDGSVGRVDGESASHNGKVEVHPGWVERLHNYLVSDGGTVTSLSRPDTLGGAPCHLLPPGALAVQTLGHLSACAVRAEVRAINILDVVLAIEMLDERERGTFGDLVGKLDGRLTAPGLWLVEQYRPGTVDPSVRAIARQRIRQSAARRIERSQPRDLLRAFDTRTTMAWRLAFTRSNRERLGVVLQIVRPPEAGLRSRARRVMRRRFR